MKTSPLFRLAGKFLPVVLVVALLLVAGAAPRAAASATPLVFPFSESFDSFRGSGFASSPSSGQLDSDIWKIDGLSDGTMSFADTKTTGDFARSSSNGGVTTGGIYGFQVATGNYILGVQPGADDFTPGAMIVRVENDSGGVLAGDFSVSYKIWTRNDQGRSNSLNFSWSTDGSTWTSVGTLDYTTPAAADASPAWSSVDRSTTINTSISAGNYLYLRWSGDDVGGSGSRDEYGIDILSVTTPSLVDNPPKVTSASPTGSGVAVSSNITINFNEAVDVTASGVTVECPAGTPIAFTSTPPLPADNAAGVTLNPDSDLPNDTTCTVTAVAAEITDNDGTADPLDGDGDGNATAGDDYEFTFTTVAAGFTKIHDIQGSGSTANAGTFSVEAIVVGDYQGATGVDDFKLDGFFIQEEDVDADANPATSEGIFVFCQTCPTNVNVGDKVQVTGASSEYFGMSQLNATTAGAVVVISTGNTLPTPASLTLPVPGVTATDLAGATTQINAYYEPFEGMLVQFGTKLTVTEYFELFRYGQVVLAQGGRFRQLTDTSPPSTSGYTAHEIDLARRTVILDDDSNQQNHALAENPDIPVFHPAPAGFSTTNYFRGGDTITNLTGVLHYSFAGLTGTDAWRIRPVTEAFSYAFTVENARPAVPPVTGNIKVASFNVLNYFTTLNSRGANSAAEFTRQSDKTVAAISGLDADVIGLMEIENNGTAIADLVTKLNAAVGAGTYAYISTGVVGTDQITVGILYKPGKVTPVGAVQTLTAAGFTDPNSTGTQRSRPAVAQTFEENTWGESFTVVVNHFKSKGCDGAAGADLDQLDGQSCWSDTRQKGATYLVNTWLASDPTGSNDPDILIIGDLNAHRKDTAISNITGAGYTDLINSYLGAAGYGYVFDGQLGYLDHALGSAGLTAQVTGVAEWHINADEVNLLDYNDTIQDAGEQTFDAKPTATNLYQANAYRSSDHDPVLVSLALYPDHSSLTGYGDAWHNGDGTPRLGSNWSRDASAGVDSSDDGVIDFAGLDANWSDGGYITVDVQRADDSGVCVYGWIDWNGNNSFADSGEASTPAFTFNSGPLEVHWADPGVFDGTGLNRQYNLRLRIVRGACGSHLLAAAVAGAELGPSANLGPTGQAGNGEVEDSVLNFTPNAVSLKSLTAAPARTLAAGLPALVLIPGLALGVFAVRRRRRG